jgi:NAD(P)-dependent dehydrogenase (short-subunit alcohol dehydrogenase family)
MIKTILITGASSGFGKATAKLFHERGYNIIATMLNPAKEDELNKLKNVLITRLDVRDTASIEAAIEVGIERFGSIDCVINNAGAGLFSVFETTPMEAVRDLFETNIFGMMQVTQSVLPHFKENGGGRFVNIASGSGIVPEPLMSIYGATKFAVEGFTEAVRYELETQNIVVKLVEPGLVSGTNFINRTQKKSEAFSIPPSYQGIVQQTMAMYMSASPFKLGTEADVAAAIVAAATDDIDKFRYVVGGDTESSAHMRRETSEEEYSVWAQSRYAAKG